MIRNRRLQFSVLAALLSLSACSSATTTPGGVLLNSGGAQKIGANWSNPYGVAVDSISHEVYVSERLTGRIFKISGDGVMVPIAYNLKQPLGLAVDHDTLWVYVAENGAGKISKIQPDGTVTTVASGLDRPSGVAIDSATHTVYFTEIGKAAIEKINPDGSVSFAASIPNPVGLSVDTVKALYVATGARNEVYRVAPGGRKYTVGSGWNMPTGVAIDSATHDLYVADKEGVKVLRSAGGPPSLITANIAPTTVALDSGTLDLYATDESANSVWRISTANTR